MKKQTIKMFYDKYPVDKKDILDEMLASNIYNNMYVAIAEWYRIVRLSITDYPTFNMFDIHKNGAIVEYLNVELKYDIKQIILTLNFLCNDAWWNKLPNAFTLFKLPSEDKNGVRFFDKIFMAFERKYLKEIQELEINAKAMKAQTNHRRFI